jgi:prevent-host-death family protein
MIVTATELKNNLGKYLRKCEKEDILITSNGRQIAVLRSIEEEAHSWGPIIDDGVVSEQAQAFECAPGKVTYEEFLKITEGNERRYEYIDGEVYLLAAPKVSHQRILGELYMLFYNWFKGKKCVVALAPFDITLKKGPEEINVVEPDISVICDLEENLNAKDYYMGVPVLVLEIISECTRTKDSIKKFNLYMASGVKEYWIVNPFEKEISVYLFSDSNITESKTFKGDNLASSFIFKGFNISLKDIS